MGKVFGSFLFCFLSLLVTSSTPASAMALSKSDTITISGIVPPAKYVYVDGNQKIKKIVSNCYMDAEVTVLSESEPTNLVPNNDNIVRQYDFIKSTHNLNRIGTIYIYSPARVISKPLPKPAKTRVGSFQLSNLFLNNIFQKF